MFNAIGNMPLHPLVVHAVVIGIPLAVLLALLFAVPATRSWARWPLAVVSVGAAAATFVARQSGEGLKAALKIDDSTPLVGAMISEHARLATQLLFIMVGFAVVALVNVFAVHRPGDAARPGAASAGAPKVLGLLLPLTLIAVAIVAAIWVVRVGDIGSRAVWNPTGKATFSVIRG